MRSPRANRAGDDDGSATVLAAFMVAALVAITLGGVSIGSAVVARHRAQAAADLAAVAAARSVPGGAATACPKAAALAAAMGGALMRCDLDGLDVVVVVGGAARPAGTAEAWARAGPA